MANDEISQARQAMSAAGVDVVAHDAACTALREALYQPKEPMSSTPTSVPLSHLKAAALTAADEGYGARVLISPRTVIATDGRVMLAIEHAGNRGGYTGYISKETAEDIAATKGAKLAEIDEFVVRYLDRKGEEKSRESRIGLNVGLPGATQYLWEVPKGDDGKRTHYDIDVLAKMLRVAKAAGVSSLSFVYPEETSGPGFWIGTDEYGATVRLVTAPLKKEEK